jgi:hypothetical protein
MPNTITRKRIEILLDAPLLPRVAALLDDAGVHGHTVLAAQSGHSRAGEWSEDALTGAASKLLVMALANAEATARLIDLIAPLLDSHRLLLSIGEVEVIRGDRY